MPKLHGYRVPLLPDADEQQLREIAPSHRVVVRINAAARRRGAPFVELYQKGNRDALLASFKNSRAAIRWLQGPAEPRRPVDGAADV